MERAFYTAGFIDGMAIVIENGDLSDDELELLKNHYENLVSSVSMYKMKTYTGVEMKKRSCFYVCSRCRKSYRTRVWAKKHVCNVDK